MQSIKSVRGTGDVAKSTYANESRKALLSVIGMLLGLCTYFLSRFVDSIDAYTERISRVERELQDLQTREKYDLDRLERNEKRCNDAVECCSGVEVQLKTMRR